MYTVEMKKIFTISALSLAIAVANHGVYADDPSLAPEDCVVEGGQGESLAEWGMWCGVGSFLAALSDLDPTAAGPDGGPSFDGGPGDPTGRGEADNFEPGVNPEDDPDDDPVTPHITPPESDGQFVGYFASQDYSYEYDYEDESEGYGYGGDVSNHQTGGFDLSLQDGDMYDGYGDFFFEGYGDGYGGGYGEGYGDPDTVDYSRYDKDGNPIDGNSFNSDDDYYNYDEDGGSNQNTDVYLEDDEDEPGSFYAGRSSYSYSDEDSPYTSQGEGIVGMEVVVYNDYEDENEGYGGPVQLLDFDESYEVLKNYWAGYFGESMYQSGRDGYSEMGRDGAFVAGVFTTLEEVQAMVSGDVSATYTGNSHQWMQSVRLEVDFGDERFSGEFGDMDPYSKGDGGHRYEQGHELYGRRCYRWYPPDIRIGLCGCGFCPGFFLWRRGAHYWWRLRYYQTG
ncbi:MAG: hypothetical protein AseanaTS_25680 [Candidatus Pelagadaptatus aseana]|uniref:hypothetical protein n=1 Tax=Candidatus Pelagadaptatus aseana TaxID=3120508 RepID=UPI0039B2F455